MNRVHLDPGHVGFVTLIVLALANAVAVYVAERAFGNLRVGAEWAQHTQHVLTKVQSTMVAIINAETQQRGLLISADPAYRGAYRDAVASAQQHVEELARLTRDNPVQVAQMQTMRSMAHARIALLEEGVDRFDREGSIGGAEHIRSGRGKSAMDALRLSLAGIESEERAQYERRTASFEANLAQVRRGAVVSASLNLLLVTLGALFLLQEFRRRRDEQAAASRRAAELESAVAQRTSQLSELTQFLQRFQEEEKARVARDIHDELGGTLAAAKIDLQLLSDKLGKGHGQETRIARLMAAIDDAVQVKRRIIEDLRPTMLDNLGFAAALRWQCDQFSKRGGQPCRVEIEEEGFEPGPDHAIAFYRIVQEALTNVSKYANARSVAVSLRREAGHWLLQVSDDGVGIDPAKPRHRTAHGLLSMRERARSLGGDLAIEGVPGRGTVLRVRVPVRAAAPADSEPVGGD